jgi:hypothetical protein
MTSDIETYDDSKKDVPEKQGTPEEMKIVKLLESLYCKLNIINHIHTQFKFYKMDSLKIFYYYNNKYGWLKTCPNSFMIYVCEETLNYLRTYQQMMIPSKIKKIFPLFQNNVLSWHSQLKSTDIDNLPKFNVINQVRYKDSKEALSFENKSSNRIIFNFKNNKNEIDNEKYFNIYNMKYSLDDINKWKSKDKEIVENYLFSILSCKESIKVLTDCIFTALSGNVLRYLVCITGETKNGKSTFFNLLNSMFGNYAKTIDEKIFIEKKDSETHPEREDLLHLRIGTFTEPPSKCKLNESFIKKVTGGDDITVRPLYVAPYTGKPTCSLFMACNKPPIFTAEPAMNERLVVFNFPNKFEKNIEEDNRLLNIESKLFTYIMTTGKIIDKVVETDKMKEARNIITDQSNIIKQFINETENYEINKNAIFSFSKFIKDLKIWAISEGQYNKFKDHIEDKENLKKLLEKEGILPKLRKDGTLCPKQGKFRNPYTGLEFINYEE